MPEHFFHIRLDCPTSISNQKDSTTKRPQRTNLFATPPELRPISANGPAPSSNEATGSPDDWRAGRIVVQSIDMIHSSPHPRTSNGASSGSTSTPALANSGTLSSNGTPSAQASLSKSIRASTGNAATRARFEPTDAYESEAGWGVVRVFRDTDETPGLYDVDTEHSHHHRTNGISGSISSSLSRTAVSSSRQGAIARGTGNKSTSTGTTPVPIKDEDCTTLAILAVPSYMSPADLMGWVGEKTRDEVSHFRLIKTERANRYMVLMRFRNGRRARVWRKDWNGASFDAAEPETAHVVFVKSIEFTPGEHSGDATFSDVEDPFTSKTGVGIGPGVGAAGMTVNAKPLAPPTPSLVEMPTCPVCLERMDESTGLLTIQCQHVFHCTCLHKWRGSGCPVCRFTHDGLSGRRMHALDASQSTGPNECSICRSDSNLWICLICGNVGCGRYDAAHAFLHWQHSEHTFAMDMGTQRIWDYAGDGYVHRIVQNKLDGKIAEREGEEGSDEAGADDYEEADYIPREKSDAIGREYTALLTSQLESQRAYFEEKVSLVADKASQASLAATQATEAASHALDQLARLQEDHRVLVEQTVPGLERDRERAIKRADKAQEMARKFEKEWKEEKAVNEGLMERVKKLDAEIGPLREETADLKEMNRDLQFFISGQQKLKDMELGEDVVDGSVSIPEEKRKKARKGKKKDKDKGKEMELDTEMVGPSAGR